jgi:hypothetical protein
LPYGETIVTQWLIAKDTDGCQQGTEQLDQRNDESVKAMTVKKQNYSSEIKSELFFSRVENESPQIHALQIYFLTDRRDVLVNITGYEVMRGGLMSTYRVSYCRKKRDICMKNKRGDDRNLRFIFRIRKVTTWET